MRVVRSNRIQHTLLAVVLVAGVGVVQAKEDGEAVRWAQLRTEYAERLAAHDAVPYSSQYHPEIFQALDKRDRLRTTIERLRRQFVRLILDTGRCPGVEMVHVDLNATTPQRPVLWLDCDNGTTYRADASQIRRGEVPPPDRMAPWSEARARTICELLVTRNGPSRRPPTIIEQQAHKDARGAWKITLYYQRPIDNEKRTSTRTAVCTFVPGEYPRVVIGRGE